jgi:branched-chain amino acid transport system ATP-binding protein
MGLWPASHGEIVFGGERIEASTTPDIARRGVGYVPESMAVFSDLTVKENLVLGARAGSLSGGQKQMLSIARAIVEERKLLLIDEPTKGLAPAIVKAMTAAIAQLKETNTTILLVEQNFAMACAVGDTVAVMDDGRIVHTGTMAALAGDAALQHRLMGLSLEAHR